MGLDMYLYGKKFFWTDWDNPKNNRMEDDRKISSMKIDLGYWRKHPNLHGYIVQTFAKGVDECQEIELSKDDLVKIIDAVEKDNLPETEGFFFGSSEGWVEYKDEVIKTFKDAIQWLEDAPKSESRDVVYQASW